MPARGKKEDPQTAEGHAGDCEQDGRPAGWNGKASPGAAVETSVIGGGLLVAV